MHSTKPADRMRGPGNSSAVDGIATSIAIPYEDPTSRTVVTPDATVLRRIFDRAQHALILRHRRDRAHRIGFAAHFQMDVRVHQSRRDARRRTIDTVPLGRVANSDDATVLDFDVDVAARLVRACRRREFRREGSLSRTARRPLRALGRLCSSDRDRARCE